MIKTEVIFIDTPLEEQLQSDIEVSTESGEQLTRFGRLDIDDKPAIRIWSEGGMWDFPNQISSYIHYSSDKTIVIHSYYDSRNSTAVDTIQRIHWSFRMLD